MPVQPKILAFSGSARKGSLNKKLLAIAVDEVRRAGAEVTHLEINDYPMPLYHGDLEDEAGMPENAEKLVALIQGHHALLIASPEYNSQITPLLKNTIDWCTRADDNPFVGKTAAIISASPGPFGGVRSNLVARTLLMKVGCFVMPAICVLAHADQAFDDAGVLKNARSLDSVKAMAAEFVRTTGKLIA